MKKDGNNVFAYWTDPEGKTVDFDGGVQITGDTTFKANWEEGYKVTLVGGDKIFRDYESSTIEKYYHKNRSIRVDGYRIDGEMFRSDDGEVVIGWKRNPNDEELFYNEEYELNGDLTLHAVWGREFELKLNAGEGVFSWSEYGENSKYYAMREFVEGETLDSYSGKSVKVNGEDKLTYAAILSADQLVAPEGKIFEGWYYDADLTQPVQPGTVMNEALLSAHPLDEDGRFNLYAKFTSEYNTVTLDANGGYLYGVEDGSVASYSLVCPAGKALDLSNHMPEKEASDGEYEKFIGWYKDAAGNEKADVTEDMVFVPSETTRLYAKWRIPISNVYFWMSYNGDKFFLDGDCSIDAYLEYDGALDPKDWIYNFEIEVYDTQGEEDIEYGDLTPIATVKNDADNEYLTWDYDSKKVVLHGSAISQVVDNLGISRDNIRLKVSAVIFTEDGEFVANDWSEVLVGEPQVDYTYNYDYDEERLVGSIVRISKYNIGRYYSDNIDADNDGEFEFEISSVEANGSELQYDADDEAWYYSVVKGENVIKITPKEYYPATGELTVVDTIKFTGVTDIYRVNWMERANESVLPGETNTITAHGEHIYMYDGEECQNGDFTYKWDIVEGADYVELGTPKNAADNSWSSVSVKAKEGIDPEVFEDGDVRIEIAASLVAKGNKVAEDSSRFYVSNLYAEMILDKNGTKINEFLPKGGTVTITPVVKIHEYSNGKAVVRQATDAKFGWDFNSDDIQVKNGSVVVSEYDGTDGTKYSGSFTFKRLSLNSSYWYISAFIPEEDGWWNFDGFNGWLNEMYEFRNPQVFGIKNKTYTGKAQKQSLEVAIDDPYFDYDGKWYLEEGEQYKVVYKNNINAGTATVEIVGLYEFSGQKITKTFKINKAANTLKAAGKTTTVKYSTLKNKAQTRTASQIINFKNKGQGTKSYTLYTAKKGSKSFKKYFAVNKSNGKLTIKKGLAKGTYTLKVRVKAAGNSNYKASTWKTVTVKVKVS